MELDRTSWSGEGDLTRAVIEALAGIEQVAYVRVEDAPSSRAGTGFNLLANEMYVGFRVERAVVMRRLFGGVPFPALTHRKSLTLDILREALARVPGVGPADYADEGMLQYLRSERVAAYYQARGPKLLEMLRIYEALPAPPAR
jgi:hypothetical protein